MNNKRQVSCPFGLLNIGGLMETQPILDVNEYEIGAEVVVPLFCHDTYKVKTTFNENLDNKFAIIDIKGDDVNSGSYYQKKFRRMVLWDFGDGYKKEGYSVEHFYSKPGRYKITCTFYDINRCAWKNDYHIYVTVKEIIPTQLSFVKPYTKSEILCSKIERVAKLEALLSLTTKEELKIQTQRIFTENEIDSNFEEVSRNYKEIPDEILKFTRKYWTFLENKQQLLFQSDKIYSDNLNPTDLYTPNYTALYGKFYYDKESVDEPIKIHIFQVIPYKNIDEKLKTIRILNPNCKIKELLEHEGEEQEYLELFTRLIDIKQVYTQEQLPKDAIYIGKRAFVDIFYKNDYITSDEHLNTFSFFYDIEHQNITKELDSSDNYLNINPLGLSIRVKNNDISRVKVGVSLDGFLREVSEEDDWSAKNYYVDPYLRNGLVKDIDLDFYFFPYIEYNMSKEIVEGTDIVINEESNDDFITNNKMYYVPKDCEFSSNIDLGIAESEEGVSFEGEPSKLNENRNIDYIESWLQRVPFALHDYFAYTCVTKLRIKDDETTIEVPIIKESLIKPDELSIPTEKTVKENINELVETYMIHPMFEETPNIKEFFKIVLNSRNLVNYSLTKSKNFIDDHANVKTCYLSALISILKMMGEDILEYEKGAFEGVNDLRDFVRLLTINHSDLVGHIIGEKLDTIVRLDRTGKNVSDEIKVDDVLTLQTNNKKFTKGKVLKLTRDDKDYDCTLIHKDGVDIIVHDKYTHDTKVVNFNLVNLGNKVQINDYEPSWGWNLLLPKRYDDCLFKLKTNESYKKENGVNLYSYNELQRIKQTMKEILSGYYSFHLLNPKVDNVRVGNFLENSTITERINDVDDWSKEWGITHEILMKIFRDNGSYKHTNYVLEDNLSNTRIMRVVDDSIFGIVDQEISNILTSVYNGGMLSYEANVNCLMKVYGMICEGTEQYLELQLKDSSISDEESYTEIETEEPILLFKIIVDEEGVIHPTKQVYKVKAGQYDGYLNVSLCGKLKKEKGQLKGMMWDVSLELFSH